MGLPGVKVGPLDPDATAEFGQVAQKNSARQLIRLHAQLNPPELVRALARPLDPERTKALVIEEVRGYLAGLERENGDPVVPEGSAVVGAQVRGERDAEQIVTFTYRLAKSGRTGKWFAPYDVGELSESAEAGDELVRAKDLRDRGLVAFDAEGASSDILRRQVAGLRRENDALRKLADSGGAKEIPEEKVDVRPDDRITADNEQLGRENEELKAEVARLRVLAERVGEESIRPDAATIAAEEPPFDGYDDVNARDLVKRIRDEDTSREDVRAILDYERTHQSRRSVVGAAEVRLGRT